MSKDLLKQVNNLPKEPGVYIYRDLENRVIYVGKAVSLRNRVSSYFQNVTVLGPKTQKMVSLIEKIEHVNTETEMEALILEAELIKRYKPEFNVQWKDDKGYKYIKIKSQKSKIRTSASPRTLRFAIKNKEEWPYVTTSRRQDDQRAQFFGPFPQGQTVNEVLKTLRPIFPWCKYTSPPRDKKPCFYYHLGLCPGICAGFASIHEYRDIISKLIIFLKGKKKDLIFDLQKEMKEAANKKDFEQAAAIRDQINKLQYIIQRFHAPADYLQNPNLIQDERIKEINSLLSALNLLLVVKENFRIEAFDISNLQGKLAVGSMVVATGGAIDKKEYRRFKIKISGKPNDAGMMKEMLSRRFSERSHLSKVRPLKGETLWKLPNLIVVDGGASQLGAALTVLREKNLQIPIIGLAKKLEEVYQPLREGEGAENITYRILRLPKGSPALHLLQRIRDEAHRFAITYHRQLRSKELKDIIKKSKVL